MKPVILSLGTMYLDIIYHNFPYGSGLVPNQEVVGNSYEVVPGGSALNFARVCAAIDLTPVFIGKTGKDKTGQLLRELVEEAGIIPAFVQSHKVTTNIGMNYIGEDESSIMTVAGSANQSLAFQEVEDEIAGFFGDIKYLYLGGGFKLKSLLLHYDQIIREAREKKVKIVLDHGRVTNSVTDTEIKIIKKVLPLVDYYLPSRDELLAVWEVAGIKEAIKKIRKVSDAIVVVKDAESGAYGFSQKKTVEVPIFKVKVKNTVGAGDSFNAGFIKAQEDGLNFVESIRFACATAALKISQDKLPTVGEIKIILKSKK
jgi:sugar/nucleoside kinase (ribokinase family)